VPHVRVLVALNVAARHPDPNRRRHIVGNGHGITGYNAPGIDRSRVSLIACRQISNSAQDELLRRIASMEGCLSAALRPSS
jgi:hypothetical protein